MRTLTAINIAVKEDVYRRSKVGNGRLGSLVLTGTVAGVYVGMEYGLERVRGTRDWKNAMLGGALTGALVSAVSSNKGDRIITDAITGGAIATAAEFIKHLT
ncbi:hypothetical protein OSB04_020821 [Centaurea solstitialis]|uniref:Uncharacterized protein n=1 Tax=Centaurea solstitialis TaxID=347529 RepID=A0AA38STD7_9ASTR|nr:hypothetical protein OSB04_020821 [Centaurea solstitialis]